MQTKPNMQNTQVQIQGNKNTTHKKSYLVLGQR